MATRTIGSLEVSTVGVGCNSFGPYIDAERVVTVVDSAFEHGVTLFDTADIYGRGASEELLGQALKDRRDEVVIATKFGGDMGEGRTAAAGYVRRAAEASLRRLGTDRIDLYQLHFPDAETPVAETLAALDELVVAGKVREIGCSNFTPEMLREASGAVADGGASFVSVQNHLSLLERADSGEALATCEELGLSYLPYFPLARGLLSGRYRRGEPAPAGTRLASNPERSAALLTDPTFDTLDALTAFAEAREHTLLELAFAWLLAHRPVASVIAGATSAAQVAANAQAGEWELAEDDLAAVGALLAGG